MSLATWQERWKWPEQHGPAREARLLQAVAEGEYLDPTFNEVTTEGAGHTATWVVMGDAFRVGAAGDSKRAIGTHQTSQAIADLFNFRILSPKVLDAIAKQADVFIDFAQTIGGTQDATGQPYKTTAKMVEHSDKLDTFTGGETAQLVGGGWKDWVLSSRLLNPDVLVPYGKNTAINYGYFSTGPLGTGGKNPWPSMTEPSLRVWQQPGAAHNAGKPGTTGHSDVSQKFRWMSPQVFVQGPLVASGGEWLDVDAVSMHPVLFALMHHDVPQPARHPWLPLCTSFAEGGGCPDIEPPPGGPPGGTPPVATAGYDASRLVPIAAIGLVAVAYFWSR